jgi:c-di-GMP-related signal transduction protein
VTNVTRILLNMRMSDALAEIPVDAEIKRALSGFPSRHRSIFEVVLDCESGTWEQLASSLHAIGMNENLLPDLQLRSVQWVRSGNASAGVAGILSARGEENLFRHVKRMIRRGHAAVNSCL